MYIAWILFGFNLILAGAIFDINQSNATDCSEVLSYFNSLLEIKLQQFDTKISNETLSQIALQFIFQGLDLLINLDSNTLKLKAPYIDGDSIFSRSFINYPRRSELINLLDSLGRLLESLESLGIDLYCSKWRMNMLDELRSKVNGKLRVLLESSLQETGERCVSKWAYLLEEYIEQNKIYDIAMNKAIDTLTNNSTPSRDDWTRTDLISHKLVERYLSPMELETMRRYKVIWGPSSAGNDTSSAATPNLFTNSIASSHRVESLSEFCRDHIMSGPEELNHLMARFEQTDAKVRKWLEFKRFCSRL